jgi:hypothetical protein
MSSLRIITETADYGTFALYFCLNNKKEPLSGFFFSFTKRL